jgi:hypothetical protein
MRRHQLATAALGIGYVTLSFAGLALAPLPDLGTSAAHDSTYLAARQTVPFTAGSLLLLAAYLALLAFLVKLAYLSGPNRGTPARALATAGATLTFACVASGLGLAGAVVLHRTSVPPPVAATLLDAASLATWIATLGIALALAAVGWSTVRTPTLPRWTGWTALAIAATFAACLPFARTGAGHLPAIAADLWIIAAAITVLTRCPGSTAAAPQHTTESANVLAKS